MKVYMLDRRAVWRRICAQLLAESAETALHGDRNQNLEIMVLLAAHAELWMSRPREVVRA